MALEWGVIPLLVPEATDVQELWDAAIAPRARPGSSSRATGS